ncbi:MAG: electron transport complex subunit RsxC [Acidobacteriota bacterium]
MSAQATVPQVHSGSLSWGVHPDDRKQLSADAPIEVLPTPAQVRVPLLQHLGAPNEAVVKPRTAVAWGDVLGRSDAFVSAPVHAPIAGKTARVGAVTLPNGRRVAAVPIKAEGEQVEGRALFDAIYGGPWPHHEIPDDPRAIVAAVREAGIVGLGGAAFPTHVKLSVREDRPIHTLILNGAECEPYLTADYRLMLEAPEPIVAGALAAARAVGAQQIAIAIEDNKPAAIGEMKRAVAGTPIRVVELKTRYPMGGERQLIYAVTGLVVPTGGLPLDVGVVVMNVGTAAAVARAVLRGKPLTHRIVSVTGEGIATPKNLLVPIGVSYAELVACCGGLTPDATRAVAGGPMMGFTLGSLDIPVTKGTSGLTVLTDSTIKKAPETNCVRCGRCVDVCPIRLVPTRIALAARHKAWDIARAYHITACIECGCCAYTCPANIPLTQLIRMGKAELPRS